MDNDIIFFSRVEIKPSGGGGCRRESQLINLLKSFKPEFFSAWDSRWFKNQMSRKESFLLRLNKKINPHKKFWHPFYHDYVFKLRAVSKSWIQLIKKRKNVELVFIDDPVYFAPLVQYLSKKEIPFIGLSQNIESLSYNQLNSKYQLDFFKKEMTLLRKSRLNITISREETFILKNFNIQTIYIPYYPVPSIEKRLLQIKEDRKNSKKYGFLIIGNAWNKVTLEGMKKLINFWVKNCEELGHENLLVAGFGTEQLLSKKKCDNITYLGEISDEKLDNITIHIKAMICFQEYGSGALTKIKEMLIAGVPILANHHSARSYRKYKSILKFSRLPELKKLIIEWDTIKKEPENIITKPETSVIIKIIKDILHDTQDPE